MGIMCGLCVGLGVLVSVYCTTCIEAVSLLHLYYIGLRCSLEITGLNVSEGRAGSNR